MEGTRRYWEAIGVSGVLAAGALILGRPLLLGGAAGIWVWALLQQLRFAHTASVVTDDIQVTQSVSDTVVTTDTDLELRMTAEFADAAPAPVSVTSQPPLIADAPPKHDRTIHFEPGDHRGTATYQLRPRAAGRTNPRGVQLQLRDEFGLFAHTWNRADADSRPSFDVRPYGPRDIHVGAGTEPIGRGYGEHDTEYSGGGIEPLELREYVPGDSLSRIDWKATARLAEPYIREHEATADRTTLLVVDHRAEMGRGEPGRTMLDHGRTVGTAVIEAAEQLTDPLGWLTVGDYGITERTRPRSTPEWYRTARRTLNRLEPTSAMPRDGEDALATNDGSGPVSSERNATSTQQATIDDQTGTTHASSPDANIHGNPGHRTDSTGPMAWTAPLTTDDRHRIGRILTDDESAFGTTLRPFFTDTTEYIHTISTEPLFRSLRLGLRNLSGRTWSIIITSDARPAELLEAVRFARQGDNHVLVFLTPSVLFTPTTPDSLDEAYEQYREFEQLREQLDQYQRVSAFEVGPRDQLTDILSSQRTDHASDEQHVGEAD